MEAHPSHIESPHAKSPYGPLQGVRVIDLSINVLGPMGTQILGDMGADVVKVETPAGDDNRRTGPSRGENMAALFLTFNRNKRSIVLDLGRPDHREVLLRLIDGADVFVHGMRRKSAEKLGIGYQAVASRNPRVIYAYGGGYSQSGPYRDRPAFDDIIQAASGLAGAMARSLQGEPRYMPTVVVDKLCGYVLASSVAMALYARERTGRGQEIEVPMMESAASFLLHEHLFAASFDPPSAPVGYPRMFTPSRRPYPTKDGHIGVVAINDAQWRRLLTALGRADLVDDVRFASIDQRTLHIDTVYATVEQELKAKTTREWQAIFDAADIPNSPVRRIEDLLQDSYLWETGFFRRYNHPSEGQLVTTAIPVRFSDTPGDIRRPPPRLGEHGAEILQELGYGAADVEALLGPHAAASRSSSAS